MKQIVIRNGNKGYFEIEGEFYFTVMLIKGFNNRIFIGDYKTIEDAAEAIWNYREE